MMSDLISRSWMMEQLDGLGDTRLIKRNFIALVTNAQTVDAVEVVRCRECHCYTTVDEHTGKCVFLIGEHQYVAPDGYCYLGERKEGADNG